MGYDGITYMQDARRVVLNNADAVLEKLFDGARLVRDIKSNAIWLEKTGEIFNSNVSFGVFNYLVKRGYIDESHHNEQRIYHDITKVGKRDAAKQFGPPPVIKKKAVEPKPRVLPAALSLTLGDELRNKIENVTVFQNKMPDGKTIVTIISDDVLMLSKLCGLAGVPLRGEKRSEPAKETTTGIRNNPIERPCFYCHGIYFVKSTKTGWRNCCSKPGCKKEYKKDWNVRVELKNEGVDISGL